VSDTGVIMLEKGVLPGSPVLPFGLYTILPPPILYGVWHKKRGGGGGGAFIEQWTCNGITIG